ncbi:MAG: nucleotidyltransferase family protein [Candidatus Absconditabacterales bacterium]
MQIKDAFILAAGYGTRLRPLTLEIPKPLLPIDGKPLLAYHFDSLQKHGINKIYVNSFYLNEQIDHFVEKYTTTSNIIVSHEEGEILGTVGGVMKKFNELSDVFFVVYGDNLTNFDYSKYMQFLEGKDFDVSIVLYHEPHIEEKGMAVVDVDGYVKSFIEKPKKEQIVSDLANAGIYVIKKSVLKEFCPEKGFFDFGNDLFPLLLQQKKKILSYISDCYLLDIGNMEKYAEANAYVKNNPDSFRF